MSDPTIDPMEAKIDEIVARIGGGCSEEAFRDLRCPACDSLLKIAVQPGMQVCTVMCRFNAMHLRWHVRPKQLPAPEWWSRFVVVPPPPPPPRKKR